ncbi:MAG: 1-deoxy-D-xylulose-5-phosphate synthase [Candidatus Omnitrophica bacterium]|nr:1-deoxy-D-xylulose-5-phosphate synthase [Candidatus Omnitrophota bacterium]
MAVYLPRIHSPADLKEIPFEELPQVAREIRETIIDTVSRVGGHFAPNLGVVELALVLHYILDSPRDTLIWDIGHQSYPHKILTGRYERFSTLKQFGGISGYPDPKESEHDPFMTSHASPSIAHMTGLTMAREFKHETDRRVVAVIGDGGLTGGLAFEGLNNAGHLKRRMLLVLNDNEMSIAKNVGAISNYLSRVLSTPLYNRLRKELETFLKHIPLVGGSMLTAAKRFEEAMKNLLVPGIIFEELGFRYLGPIDGHDMNILRSTLTNALKMDRPVLVHVLTKKGKGYPPAEKNAYKFHGAKPFDKLTGVSRPSGSYNVMSYTEVFSEALIELATRDPRIVAITAAMPDGTGLDKFAEAFPERFFDVGIAEQFATAFAAGLAKGGMRPVAAIYSTFMQRAVDQVIHDVCLQDLPVVFCIDRAGLVGEDGPQHHGAFDLGFLGNLPNMHLMAPKDEQELRDMLATALSLNHPSAIRYPKSRGLGVSLRDVQILKIGRAEVLEEGEDVAIFALGSMVAPAREAVTALHAEGIHPVLVNARFVKPLDDELISRVAHRVSHVITVEEHSILNGYGAQVALSLARQRLRGVQLECMGLPDLFVEHGERGLLLTKCGLSARSIMEKVKSCLTLKT